MASLLYTTINCKHCEDAKDYLKLKNEDFVEIPFNGITNLGIQQAIGRTIYPLLVRDDNLIYFWVETEPGVKKFVKILS